MKFKVEKQYVSLRKFPSSSAHRAEDKKDVKTWPIEDTAKAKEWVNTNSISVSKAMNVDVVFYSLDKLTFYKNNSEPAVSTYMYNFALRNEVIDKYGLTQIDDMCNQKNLWEIYNLLSSFGIPVVEIWSESGNQIEHYTDLKAFNEVIEELNTEHQPFVIKNTDWPYWFEFRGNKVASKTSSWYKYLFDNYHYISDNFLVPYEGPDKESEHKDNEIIYPISWDNSSRKRWH